MVKHLSTFLLLLLLSPTNLVPKNLQHRSKGESERLPRLHLERHLQQKDCKDGVKLNLVPLNYEKLSGKRRYFWPLMWQLFMKPMDKEL